MICETSHYEGVRKDVYDSGCLLGDFGEGLKKLNFNLEVG